MSQIQQGCQGLLEQLLLSQPVLNPCRDSVHVGKAVVVQVNFGSLGFEPNNFLQSLVRRAVLPIHDGLTYFPVATGHSSLCP